MDVRITAADLLPNYETGSTLVVVASHIVRVAPTDSVRSIALLSYLTSGARDADEARLIGTGFVEVRLLSGGVPPASFELSLAEAIGLGLREDGAVIFERDGLQTFAEVRALFEAGLISADGSHLVAYVQGGRGGGEGELADAIEQIASHLSWIGIDSAIAWLFGRLTRRMWRRRGVKTARLIATDWAHRGLTSSAYLREFVERKTVWTDDELKSLLRLSKTRTRRLLVSLGYEQNSRGQWMPGSGNKARRRRERWLEDELQWPPALRSLK